MTGLLTSPSVSSSVSLVDGRPCVSSLTIAEHFGKRHTDVMRDIRSTMSKCPAEFNERNFASVKYTDAKGEERDAFNVFQDGFILVVMSYTGTKAMRIKIAYIIRFNEMAEELRRQREAEPLKALPSPSDPINPDQQCTLQNMVTALVDKGGVYANIWSRFNNHFRLGSYKQLPQSRMGDAIAYLMQLEIAPAQKALPAAEQSNVYFHGSPEFILRELEKDLAAAMERSNEMYRWAWAMESQSRRLTSQLYRHVMRKLTDDNGLANQGVNALNSPMIAAVGKIADGMEDMVAAIRSATVFARAVKGATQLEGTAHLSLPG